MLDAHPDIWGMGEDSVFNVHLPNFRDEVVKSVSDGVKGMKSLKKVIEKHGKYVENVMIELARNSTTLSNKPKKIRHIVDKMLFNYRNIGKLHHQLNSFRICPWLCCLLRFIDCD